jgi:DNA modification methylase
LNEIKKTDELPVTSIYVQPGRARKIFDPQKLIELSTSIKNNGLIQPLVMQRIEKDGKTLNRLVAGERRYRAACMAGKVVVPVVWREDIDDLSYRVIELEENIGREDLKWDEKAFLFQEIHKLQQEKNGIGGSGSTVGWTVEKTAKLVGEDHSAVAKQLKVAKKLKERPDIHALIKDLPLAAAMQKFEQIETTERVEKLRSEGKIHTFTNFQKGDCCELIKRLDDESIDCGIMDAPYGIPDLEKSRGGDSQTYTSLLKSTDNLSASEVDALMVRLTPELYRVLKPGAHLWMFFGWDVFNRTCQLLTEAGFDVVGVPTIWYKGKTTAKFMGYEPSPCFEPILLAHRGKRSRRLRNTMKALVEFAPIADNIRTHPFEKPSLLLQFLLEQSTQAGEVVLDCFAGSASTIRTAQQLGRSGIGFELDNDHYNRGQENLNNDLKLMEKK